MPANLRGQIVRRDVVVVVVGVKAKGIATRRDAIQEFRRTVAINRVEELADGQLEATTPRSRSQCG